MSRQKRKPTISALEPRILFDGAAVATGVEVLDNSSFDSNHDTIEDTPPATQTPKDRIEIAFVDSNLPDYQNLVDGISSDIQVYIVDSNVNGLDFMADVLSTMQDVDALHILGHGSEGSITLGTATLNKDNLSQYNDILSSLGDSLDENGDILLYGCSVSSGENGVSFIQNLSEITKADISASTNATGLGGDWELESSTGIIETESLSFPTYAGDMGIPSISGLGDVTFTEDGSAVNPGSNISITNGSSYDGKYIEYSLTNGSSSDQLTLTSDANVNASGAISVDGNNVYLGNGSGKDVIGSIDSTYNGQNGQKLRINFVSSFSNASFETGTITGWTAMNQMINLGSTVIAGWTSQDTSDYSNNANSGGNDNDVPSNGSYSTSVVSESGNNTDGSYALKLTSSMTTANGYDVVHGPAVYSSEFQASSGDIIYFDWRAYAGGDDFDAFGYIVNVNTGAQIEVLDATGGSNTAWTTKATTISTSGTYRFVFVNGTYDASGGRAAGGQLYIDNVRVYGNKVNDAVVTSISKLIAFSNTSEAPTTTARTFTVTAVDSNGNSGSASSTINVTSVNDLPYITGVETATVNEDTSITISGITVSDVDSANLTVTISANNGNLSLGSSSGLSVTGSGTHNLVITGSSANLNTALATLRYQGDANWFGSDPLTITVNDNDGSGEHLIESIKQVNSSILKTVIIMNL
ncbi:MAG: DUF4347 domain-containing protein [Arcobacteraceae bacterium]|nr:DUF4347 domain-containing protein [Arcobacteraceae bacterium]